MTLSKETIGLIAAFKDPTISALKDFKTEVEYFFDNGIANYINVQQDKFNYTKTFLFRSERVKFYDTFYPVKLSAGGTRLDIKEQPLKIFDDKRCVSLIGYAGSGKSMLMKHIFLSTLHSYTLIPIVIELRDLNDYEGSISDFIYSKVFNNRLSPTQKILERVLTEGNFLFLLDGYDEIYSKNKQKITNDIDDFIDRYSKNYFLITSRPGSNIESLPRFDNLYVESLLKSEIDDFIKIQLSQTDAPELAVKIIDVINKDGYKSFEAYLGIPLLLSMFILTFETHPVLPKSKSRFYWNVFDTLSSRHDSITKKGGYQHERKTGLQPEEIENILKWLSYHTLFEGKFSFDRQYFANKLQTIKSKLKYEFNVDELIDDLTVSLSIIVIDGLDFKFPHRSMQEYFTALLIRELPSELKATVYSDKVALRYRYGSEDNNFWDLCYELDKSDFLQHYLLKTLSDFCNDVLKAGTSDAEVILKYCSVMGPSNRIVYDTNEYTVKSVGNWISVNEMEAILRFLGKSWTYITHLSLTDVKQNFDKFQEKKLTRTVKLDDDIDSDAIEEYGEDAISIMRLEYYFYGHDSQGNRIENKEKNADFTEIAISCNYHNKIIEAISKLREFISITKQEIEEEKQATISLLL